MTKQLIADAKIQIEASNDEQGGRGGEKGANASVISKVQCSWFACICLSPMINSRWPRPIGTNESTALIPVCIGSRTETRGIIPGALIPTRKRSLVLMAPLPSIALPRASTTRPNISLPTGTSTIAPVRFTISPCLISLSLPKTTTPTLSGSKFKAIPFKPEENSTISSA
uniref:Uncharacterized protein n=1 Tax=Glossina palpalis gambiensis TaxID=67801 RepID=A0A1B0BN72_9MUSC